MLTINGLWLLVYQLHYSACYWVITSLFTGTCLKPFSRKNKSNQIPPQKDAEAPTLSDGGNAKDLDSPTPAQIQAAKDFVWEHLEQHAKPLLIQMATKSPKDRLGMYQKTIVVRGEAKAPFGVLTEEILIIGFDPSIGQPFPDNNIETSYPAELPH